VRLVAVGDILMHEDVKRSAAAASLPALWEAVEPVLRRADIAFANLETPVAPRTGAPGRPFQFNAPDDLPGALKASGFTVLSTANNHAYDQGVAGVLETLDRLRAAQLVAVGSGATRAEAEQPRVVQVNGLRVAFLGFTDLFNIHLNRRASEPWVCPLDPAGAAAAVRAARGMADAVVVSLHWGTEYSHQPQARQRAIAAQLAEAGADVILGSHPHVLQPVEVLDTGGRRTLVVYSMGNFISNQDRTYQVDGMAPEEGDNRDGVAVQCRLVKRRLADGSERVRMEDPVCEPLWTLNNWRECQADRSRRREIRVIPVLATLEALRAGLEPAGGAGQGRDAHDVLLRTLQVRRERAQECLGGSLVPGSPTLDK
jgi:poly-gamma-glutamate synthesis protein (capsule biosynthesis protein)